MSNMKAELLMRERRVFVSVDQLLDDFLFDVATWKGN
jgi:hypothetical protein